MNFYRQRRAVGWLFLMSVMLMAHALMAHADQTDNISVINPHRAFGYSLGDVIEQRVSLQRDNASHSIQQLPIVQREGRWVARNSVSLSADGQWLDMRYQIINAPPDTRTISLPELSLQTDAGTSIEVPAWSFTIAPLLPAATAPDNALPLIQPDWQPPAPTTDQIMRRMLIIFAGLCLILLLWAAWWLLRGWLEVRSLPFARVWHTQRQHTSDSDADTAQSWLALHRAIDQCAGRSISGSSIDELLQSVRWLEPFRAELKSFYQHSTQRFFSPDAQPANFNLASFSKRLYLAERRHTSTLAKTTNEVHDVP